MGIVRERSFSLSTVAVCTLYALCAHTAWYHRVRGASGWIDINDSVVRLINVPKVSGEYWHRIEDLVNRKHLVVIPGAIRFGVTEPCFWRFTESLYRGTLLAFYAQTASFLAYPDPMIGSRIYLLRSVNRWVVVTVRKRWPTEGKVEIER